MTVYPPLRQCEWKSRRSWMSTSRKGLGSMEEEPEGATWYERRKSSCRSRCSASSRVKLQRSAGLSGGTRRHTW